ncbi:hypothetical protein MIR68_005366 [Amoeboaphelidium protococcarum]|nr:hypothetical protein MIR68_005366 [Amoeboaphelidium protococcarum]
MVHYLLQVVSIIAIIVAVAEAKYFYRLRIFNPKPGDVWFTGDVRTVVWRQAFIPPPPVPRTVNISIHRANDSSFIRPLVQNYPFDKFAYTFTVPYDLDSNTDYRIYVRPNRLFPNRPNMVASKTQPFTIVKTNTSSVKFAFPNNGTKFVGGQFRIVRFTVQGDITDAVASLFVSDTKTGVIPNPYQIASGIPVTQKNVAYDWQVPYEFRSSTGYQLRAVVTFKNGTSPVTGVSDLFEIVQPGAASNGTISVTIIPGATPPALTVLPVEVVQTPPVVA